MPHDAQTYATTIDNVYDNPAETKAEVDAAYAAAQSKYDQEEKAIRTNFAIIAVVAPYISAINPTTFSGAPAAAVTLTVTGGGFTANSKVQVGVTERTTTFVNPTTLTATFPAPASTSALDVTVIEGNQRSNAVRMTFTIALMQENPDSSWLKADIVAWLLDYDVELGEAALNNLTKAELLELVNDVLSPAPPE